MVVLLLQEIQRLPSRLTGDILRLINYPTIVLHICIQHIGERMAEDTEVYLLGME